MPASISSLDHRRRSRSPAGSAPATSRTGKVRWTFHTVPQPGEFGNDTWEDDAWALRRQGHGVDDDERRRGARATSTCRPTPRRPTSTAAIGSATTCSPRACVVPRRRRPASASGTSRPCITACGTTTIRPRRTCSTSPSTAGASRRSRRSPSRASSTRSIA